MKNVSLICICINKEQKENVLKTQLSLNNKKFTYSFFSSDYIIIQ